MSDKKNLKEVDRLLKEIASYNDKIGRQALTAATTDLNKWRTERRKLVRQVNALLPNDNKILEESALFIE